MDIREESIKSESVEKKNVPSEIKLKVEKQEDSKEKSDDKINLEVGSESPIRLTLVEEEEVCNLFVYSKKVFKRFFSSWNLQKVINLCPVRKPVSFFKFLYS